MFDVVVIGGGVVGGLILRELTKYQLNVCLLEKASDVAMGASKANSGIVHAGFDAPVGSLKAKFNVEGNKMMEGVCADLGVKFRRNGSLVVAFSEEEMETLHALKARGEANGVDGLEIISQDKLREMAMQAVREAGAGGIHKEDLERIINNAVMRIVSALYELGFNLDGEQIAKAEKIVKQSMDRRYNTVEIV